MWQINKVAEGSKCPENGEGAAVISGVGQYKQICAHVQASGYNASQHEKNQVGAQNRNWKSDRIFTHWQTSTDELNAAASWSIVERIKYFEMSAKFQATSIFDIFI